MIAAWKTNRSPQAPCPWRQERIFARVKDAPERESVMQFLAINLEHKFRVRFVPNLEQEEGGAENCDRKTKKND